MTREEFIRHFEEDVAKNPEMYDTSFARARAYRKKMREKRLKRKKIMLLVGKILLVSVAGYVLGRVLNKQHDS
ncbi:hypothetical protein AALC25_00125 [Lachnospiraceae bacterium 29-84]